MVYFIDQKWESENSLIGVETKKISINPKYWNNIVTLQTIYETNRR